jgi:hypothetical protein
MITLQTTLLQSAAATQRGTTATQKYDKIYFVMKGVIKKIKIILN